MVKEDEEDFEEEEEEDYYRAGIRGNISTVFSVISSVLSSEFLFLKT